MSKINIREVNPAHYAAVKAEQDEIKRQYNSGMTIARLCPYCGHKAEILCRGTHGAAFVKCSNCGESVVFPPVTFRLARR